MITMTNNGTIEWHRYKVDHPPPEIYTISDSFEFSPLITVLQSFKETLD